MSPLRCAPTSLLGGSKSASGSYLLAVTEEDVRERQHRQGYKGYEARSPLETQPFIHLDSKKREGGYAESARWPRTNSKGERQLANKALHVVLQTISLPANEHRTSALDARALAA